MLRKVLGISSIRFLLALIDNTTINDIKIDLSHGSNEIKSLSPTRVESVIKCDTFYRNILYFRIFTAAIHSKGTKRFLIRLCRLPLKVLYPEDKSVEIAVRTREIGGNLYIPHGRCVINAQKIGSHVMILQGVTLGKDEHGGVPTIGNNVKIFANSVIVGDVYIGDNSYIGANTFVNFDVPANMTVKCEKPVVIEHRVGVD